MRSEWDFALRWLLRVSEDVLTVANRPSFVIPRQSVSSRSSTRGTIDKESLCQRSCTIEIVNVIVSTYHNGALGDVDLGHLRLPIAAFEKNGSWDIIAT
jgi:hypothetical protein